ncbi:MAG: hypothetical protein DCF15_17895 [Phormidesmis priestleyi]|uniref:Peptidase S74 domain-containing protein n=1 Tax=Phormidesmis priestleyi TaxID=268141 RepID=A0A2W4Z0A7_9CYAN|nr:MAG: hypothetical protein DCF15_17895 [Phormidesmis priestleyi]
MYFIREPWNHQDLVLDGAGSVGIGTDSPSATLHVAGDIRVNGDIVKTDDWGITAGGTRSSCRVRLGELNGSSGVYGLNGLIFASNTGNVQVANNLHITAQNRLRFYNNNSSQYWEIYPEWSDAGDPDLFFDYNIKREHTGWARGWLEPQGGWRAPSDGKLKREIKPLSNVLSQVMKLKPSSYRWVGTGDDSRRFTGFIAQEVEEVFPNSVSEKRGVKGLNYSDFAVLAIAALQEQQVLIAKLQKDIRSLKLGD